MSKPMERRPRGPEELSPNDLQRLRQAHLRLRQAVTAYEEFLGKELSSSVDPQVLSSEKVKRAQREIEEAEADLWSLREEVMGWKRPSGLPSAVESVDWFSDEDRVYDDVDLKAQ